MPQPFIIYVMQSAHTDIGYTHPQEQIMDMYLDHYDRVLELCRKTANAPVEHRFKWTCETFWQVEHYLTARPGQLDAFIDCARRGQIEVTGAYLHNTDLIDPDLYHRGLQRAAAFCQQYNLPLRCIMHCDINGWPWSIPDSLAALNIPYFCSQVHIDNATDPLGKRGSVHYHWLLENPAIRQDAPIRLPQAFWWEGAGGHRILHWLNEHYLLGNVLGISSPQGFHADKTRYFYQTDQRTVDDLYATASREVPRYVEHLRNQGYSRQNMLISTGGYYVDNAPPDDRWCGVIARWNAEHEDILMRTVTLGEWFDVLAADNTADLPTYRVAWPDGWAHGLGSATARIAQARRVQRRSPAVIKLVEQARQKAEHTAAPALEMALEHERFALEHTFNAWSTTARPEAAVNDFQQAVKELRFHRADLYSTEAMLQALHTLIPPAAGTPDLYVYDDQPGTIRLVHFDSGDSKFDPDNQAFLASNGKTYPVQADFAPMQHFVAALPMTASAEPYLNRFSVVGHPSSEQSHAALPDESILTSDGWTLRVDPKTGGLLSLFDRQAAVEWVDQKALTTEDLNRRYGFGQLVHEAVVHPLGREAVGNTARFIALDIATAETRQQFAPGPIVAHSTLVFEGDPARQTGAVFDAITLHGRSERLGAVTAAWRVYHALPIVELILDWHKQWSDLPEAAYVAFPFSAPGGTLELETSGGFFQPGSHETGGQLPGTCSNFYTVQRAARIKAHGQTLLWLPLDAALVMPNAIDYSRWETTAYNWNGFLASMPVNHYWHTNFATSQRGFIRLRYRFISQAGFAGVEDAIRAALPLDAAGWR